MVWLSCCLSALVATIAVTAIDAPGRRARRLEDRQAILRALARRPDIAGPVIEREAEAILGRELATGSLNVHLHELEEAGRIASCFGAQNAGTCPRPRLYRLELG